MVELIFLLLLYNKIFSCCSCEFYIIGNFLFVFCVQYAVLLIP